MASGEQYLWPAHDVPVQKKPAKPAETSFHAARPPQAEMLLLEAAASQRATLPAEKRQLVWGWGCCGRSREFAYLLASKPPSPSIPPVSPSSL